ncbi:TPA: hypothetical protein DDW35_09535, partial [Candidatus Sumerlaeota bacterium]|nr:hypothetical protein [Candidatus Sumerlaeota bacterium]
MFGFCPLYHRLILEIQQRVDEGYLLDRDAWLRRLARCGEQDIAELEAMVSEIAEMPLSPKAQYEEPEEYATIRKAASAVDDEATALDSASFLLF